MTMHKPTRESVAGYTATRIPVFFADGATMWIQDHGAALTDIHGAAFKRETRVQMVLDRAGYVTHALVEQGLHVTPEQWALEHGREPKQTELHTW